ncbi:acyltransferase family protein [Asticcacaulis sp. AND118]|uniref:acyltransferase family protein n=1 Tax=Asticcacaulis sp. AND118 TaxID=2840468 RepID=UPI001CFF62A3|nr:heparan-alpha-glucosaminide N-acetyltransferase domain-containing protein [Asticcacaulis sp. AND118]UDF02858.1 heparan-alpha-glucosaminide N-acetyltransferase domain-containing protein [Asticcacaulis sp. AND118]
MTDTRTSGQRLPSLDVLRGLTVIGMILVNATAGMYYGLEAKVFPLLLHVHWDGLKIADVVFPAFLTMVGLSIPLALHKAKAAGGLDAAQAQKIFWRTFRLFFIGWLLSNLSWLADFDSGPWRFWGVLQRIGLVYGAAAVLFLLFGPKTRLGIAAAILLLYWPLSLMPALDGLPNDLWARGHNFIASVDRVMFGASGHNYVKGPEGYDPEGLLGTLPAIAQALISMAAGEFLMQARKRSALTLAGAGAVLLAVGIGWGFVFPVVKDIWSSSFVLVTTGITLLILAPLHALLDKNGLDNRGPVTGLLNGPVTFATAFGVNAIAAYVLHFLMNSLLGWQLLTQTYFASRDTVGEAVAALFPVILFILAVWLPVEYLRRRKWIIKV